MFYRLLPVATALVMSVSGGVISNNVGGCGAEEIAQGVLGAPEPVVLEASVEAHAENPNEELELLWEISLVSSEEIEMLAQLIYTEARGIESDMEKAAVVWCVLNRVDLYGEPVADIVTAPHQFAYLPSSPVVDEFVLLAEDVVRRWEMEKAGFADVGRVLPPDYTFFAGDGEHNYFRNAYRGGDVWEWDCIDPYTEEE